MGSAELLAPLRCAFFASTYPPHAAVPIKMTIKTKSPIREVGGSAEDLQIIYD